MHLNKAYRHAIGNMACIILAMVLATIDYHTVYNLSLLVGGIVFCMIYLSFIGSWYTLLVIRDENGFKKKFSIVFNWGTLILMILLILENFRDFANY
jgi:hypothetical protein